MNYHIAYVIKVNEQVYKTTQTPMADLGDLKEFQRQERPVMGACGPVAIRHCAAYEICEDRDGILVERKIA